MLNPRNIPKRKNCGLAKYPREKISTPRNTHEKKSWNQKIATRKTLGPSKHPRVKTLGPRNIHDKKSWTHKTLTRKKFDQRNSLRHDETMARYSRDPRWHDTHRI